MLPSVESIECFLAAARLLNFRAASKTVSLTPAALGKRIAQLEIQLGTQLFLRTTRRVELTGAGLALLPHAQRLLDAAQECGRVARGETGPAPLSLTVGTRHELGVSWIVPMLDDLSQLLPHVSIELYVGSGSDLALRVRSGEIDCAISSRRTDDPRIDGYRLHREDYAFVASAKLLARRPLKRAEHAPAHTLFDAQRELPLFNYWRSAPKGGDRLAFGKTRIMGTIAVIRTLVLKGQGVAVLPRYLVRTDLEVGRFEEVFPSVRCQPDHFRLLFRTEDPRRSVFNELAKAMRKFPLR